MLMKLVSVSEMKQIEMAANAAGITYDRMMEMAGWGVAETVLAEYGHLQPLSAVGLIGKGKNGGDSLIALMRLQEAGWETKAYLAASRDDEDPWLKAYLVAGGRSVSYDRDADLRILEGWLNEGGILLDGVLGTGFKPPLTGELARLLAFISSHQDEIHVVAVDCPSGVDCDDGEASPETLKAELTICMAAVKVGLVKFPAHLSTGRLVVVPIGAPDYLLEWESIKGEVIGADRVKGLLPSRPAEGHKGTYGSLLIVGGSENYVGAVGLAARAAYRAGCGLVRVGTIASVYRPLSGNLLEATWAVLPEGEGSIAEESAKILEPYLALVNGLLIGPGLGMHKPACQFTRRLLELDAFRGLAGIVVDADGLKQLAEMKDWYKRIPIQAVLTPHPGEFSILTGLPVELIQKNREELAFDYAQKWGHTVILKGAMTVIAAPDGRWGVIPVATSGLAKAGTGDVLAGMAASFLVQGLEPYSAAVVAAWMHAQAGLVAECKVGHPASVLASDVVEAIGEVYAQLCA